MHQNEVRVSWRGAYALSLVLLTTSGMGCATITEQFSSGHVSVLVDDAHGIPVGGPVRVHGVNVGRITEVTLEAEGARIVIDALPEVVALKSDACGVVRHGVANDTYLDIHPGHAVTPLEGASLSACTSPSLELAGTESIAELTGLIRDVRAYVAQLESGARPLCAISREGNQQPITQAPAAVPEAVVPEATTAAEAEPTNAADAVP